MIQITINTTNATFGETKIEQYRELDSVLNRLLGNIDADQPTPITLRDSNGNIVGEMKEIEQ